MKKLLVTDDSGFMRDMISEVLSDAGYCVETAVNGEEMLEKYETVEPDVVFLDLVLPGINGMEALRQLKARHPGAKVVVCSAMGGQESVRTEAVEAGAMCVIQKPFTVEQIKKAVEDT